MKNQTAVEWLKFNLPSLFEHDNNGFYEKLFEQAKEMEKQQIKNAWKDGSVPDMDLMAYAERYYNETYNP